MEAPQRDKERIFNTAAEMADPTERAAYLHDACGDDHQLLDEIEDLLQHDAEVGDFLASGALRFASLAMPPIAERAGQMIGPYKLLEEIGEGGFGIVFLAQQQEPVERNVALKVIKPGMDSRQVIARFEAERQAMAMMDHPGIAKVMDAGSTDSGKPYFVMELVHGVPLSEYCDQNELTTNERLVLFVSVCQAVHHAHQKGIIHRDIKPTNVLVTQQDGKPVPKVIDFGVAKATGRHLAERTVCTSHGQMVGTPLYMSPEQAELSGLDIDTRSDIYSLGVMLYELLTGSTPFDRERIREAGYDEVRRMVREEEPPRPSDKISTLGATATIVSARRKTGPAKLRHLLRGELDWIVMKALEKDRTRRYEAATDLAKDVTRYLDNETVEACPPSVTYRLRKFVRRNKTLLTTALLVSVALLIGTVLSLWQALAAIEARRLASDHLIKVKAQQARAERAAEEARENAAYSHQLVYAADIRLAAHAWRSGDVRHFTDLLDRHKPTEGKEDLRGFEWSYLRQLGQADHKTIAKAAVGSCCAQHSPDGKYLATGRYDGTLRIWECPSYAAVAALRGHEGLLRGIAFAADGQTVASIGDDGMIRLWDVTQWKEIRSFRAHDGLGYGAHFALGGKTLVSFGDEPEIRLWDPATGRPLGTLAGHADSVQTVDISPDGRRCVSGDRSSVTIVWDLDTRKPILRLAHPDTREYPRCCRFSPDGAQIAVGSSDKLIWLWDARSGDLIRTFAGHDDDLEDIAFHPTGAMLASCDRAGVIRTWALDTTGQLPRGGLSEAAEPSEAAEAADPHAEVLQTTDVSAAGSWPSYVRGHSVRAWSVDFSPDGSRLISASKDGTVFAWSRRDRLWAEPIASACTLDIAFSPAGDQLIAAARSKIHIWSPSTDGLWSIGKHFDETACSVAVSPDGASIATGHDEGILRFWNWRTRQMTRSLTAHKYSTIDRIAFSPDGAMVATAGWCGTAKLFDTDLGKQLAVFEAPPHCLDVAFAPDGQVLAISWENNAMLIDVKSRERLHLLTGHQNTVMCLAFSPDSRWLATGSHDRTIRIWDVRRGKGRHVIAAHRNKISALAISPDGRTIVSGDHQGTVAFSHLEIGQFLFDTKVGVHKIVRMLFSPDAETLAVALNGEQIVLLHAPPIATRPKGPSATDGRTGHTNPTGTRRQGIVTLTGPR